MEAGREAAENAHARCPFDGRGSNRERDHGNEIPALTKLVSAFCHRLRPDQAAVRTPGTSNQEKEPGCIDIWVATVAKLCYIFLDSMSAHHHDCVSRGACGWEPLLTHSGRLGLAAVAL